MRLTTTLTASAGALLLAPLALAGSVTSEAPMLDTTGAATNQGWTATPIFTIGETSGAYQPVGILDGIGAFKKGANRAKVLVNHELGENVGYAYTLHNGTQLTGARVSVFDVSRTIDGQGNPQLTLHSVEPAFTRIYDRAYQAVTDPAQVNEDGAGIDGFARFCSAQGVAAGTYGFEDDIFFTGEESSEPFHPHGGTVWALEVGRKTMWAAPAVGRGAWENMTPLETGDPNTVALLLGDDTAGAPLYLYVGEKNGLGSNRFLDRNGLLKGKLYGWKANNGDLSPEQFNTMNSFRSGQFVELTVQNVAMAGQPGYDAQGYADSNTLRAEAATLGCFAFSRPEDLATNPLDGTQAAFNSTGRGSLFPSDNWGTIYALDVDFSDLSCDIVILHDADFLPVSDAGIRSPDNIDWADNGKLYVQEDRSTSPGSLFGGTTGIEASVWELDPILRRAKRIATIDRTIVAPAGTTDSGVAEIGHWESSGVLDVTALFETLPGERLLLATVQAHGISDGPIAAGNLAEGGQLLLLSKIGD
ncbi:MAG: DUF839 domain-containing protein [Planctomycetes bacterium]|nr:DUF839 domain-containing protein [Planctomycetota bacterium]